MGALVRVKAKQSALAGSVIVLVIAVILLGRWLGSVYGGYQVRVDQAKMRAEWSRVMAEKVGGIAVGMTFPAFPVWIDSEEGSAVDVTSVLPDGGLLVTVSTGCHTCLEVARTVQAAQKSSPHLIDVALILHGEDPDAMVDILRSEGCELPAYVDAEQALFREHKVIHNPTSFALDKSGRVLAVSPGARTTDDFVDLIGQLVDNEE